MGQSMQAGAWSLRRAPGRGEWKSREAALFAGGETPCDAAVAAASSPSVSPNPIWAASAASEQQTSSSRSADGTVHVVDCAARARGGAHANLFEIVGATTGALWHGRPWPGDRNIYGALAVTPP